MSKGPNSYNTLRHILVCVDASPRSRSLVMLALSLARRHASRITGLYVFHLPSPDLFYCEPPAHASARAIDEMTAQVRSTCMNEGTRLRQEFRAAAERAGVEADWCIVNGLSADALRCHVSQVDLTICRQRDLAHTPFEYLTDIAVEMLQALNRPVLVLPRMGGYSNASRRVLLDCRRADQALRALRQAIPLLDRSADVVLLRTADGKDPTREITLHLARHGINASAVQSRGNNVGMSLLSFAREFGADLVVSPDNGCSRIRELIFGSTKRTLLDRMQIPVLLAT